MEFHCYVAKEAKASLEKEKRIWTVAPLEADEVDVRIYYSGICYSDVGLLAAHYPGGVFPMVAGHEGAGRVLAVGSHVRHLKIGQAVGVGVYRDACDSCAHCARGNNNCCAQKKLLFMRGDLGTFSELVRIRAKFCIAIPDSIELKYAGPAMCAGISAFAPLDK